MAYISLFQNEKWWSHSQWSYGYISMEYSHERDGADQKYQINYSAGVSSGAYYKNGIDIYVILDDVSYQIGDNIGTGNSSSWYQEGSGVFTIKNKTSGHTGFYATVYDAKTGALLWAGGTTNLTVDPAYTTVSNSARGRTLNSISVNWSTEHARDLTQYSLNGGNWTNANDTVALDNKSGYYTISNLNPNTKYTVKTRCKRADSQLWSESGSIEITTYQIATITSAPDFTDEANPTINYSNPFGNNVTSLKACISLTGTIDDIVYRDISKTGTSYTFELTDVERNILRQAAKTKNSLSIMFFIRTTYGTTNYHSTVTKTVSIINANPTFNNFTYQDVNTDIVNNLTGNNQTIIKGYSNVKAIISVANKATANKKAEMDYYRFSVGELTEKIEYSDTVEVSGIINSVNSNTFSMYAVDSRNNSTQKTITASKYINYSPIAIGSISATRTNNIKSETTLNFSGKIWDGNFGKINNSIKECYYRYKLTTSNTWSSNINITPTKSGSTFSFNSIIKGDLAAEGFDIDNSYNIQVFIKDELSNNYSNPASFILGPGTPAVAIYKNNVAIGQRYDTSDSSKLQVNGNTTIKGSSTIKQNSTTEGNSTVKGNSQVDGNTTIKGKATIEGEASASNLPVATALQGISFNDVAAGQKLNKSFIGSVNIDGTWYNLINIRHRNGATDGDSYGLQIRNALTDKTNRLYLRSQYGDASSWSDWEPIYTAKSLYDNASGSNGTITLSESAGNFVYLEVFYSTNRGNQLSFSSQKIYNPNGKDINLNAVVRDVGQGVMYMESSLYNIGGVSMVWRIKGSSHNYTNSVEFYDSNTIYIHKVIGYR